jgi:uncharacterized membrane protein YphA (DoxX/SURF4 family)
MTNRLSAVAIGVLRIAAGLLFGHFPRGGRPVENQGELALLYASVFIAIAGTGGGAFTLDSRLLRRA